MNFEEKLNLYLDFMLEYNKKINVISRQITDAGLKQLVAETLLLDEYVDKKARVIVDAGSGNGLLGIPIALLNEKIRVVLVEPRRKKSTFLFEVTAHLGLANVEVFDASVEEYLKLYKEKRRVVVARGFPEMNVFARFISKGLIDEAVLITSDIKIKNNLLHLESVTEKTYNVPLRENLKILKMEKSKRDHK